MICHTCGNYRAAGLPEETAQRKKRRYPDAFTIDMHCHVFCKEVENIVAGHAGKREELARRPNLIGKVSALANAQMHASISGKLMDVTERLRDMEALGIDLQVISPSPTQYYYWAGADLADQLVRLQNEQIAGICTSHPDRFVGLGAISLQHPELAVAQLRTAIVELGLKGVEISSDPTGNGLDDPDLAAFWAAAERLGAVIFLHPLGTSLGERVDRYYLSNIIGQPLETTIALSEIIYAGILDRYPNLRICAAHGGGFLPYYAGRFDHGFLVREESRQCMQAPSSYLKKLYYDSVVYRPDTLANLIAVVGVEQVVVGSDYPFDMGEYALHELIESVPGLSEAGIRAILGGNASRLLQLYPSAAL